MSLRPLTRVDFGAGFGDDQVVDAHFSRFAVLLQFEPLGKKASQHQGHLSLVAASGCSCVDVVFVLVKPARPET